MYRVLIALLLFQTVFSQNTQPVENSQTSSDQQTALSTNNVLSVPVASSPRPRVWGANNPSSQSPSLNFSPAQSPTPNPVQSPTNSITQTATKSPSTSSCFTLKGVNQAGADFGSPGGAYGSAYTYPEPGGSTSYFVKLGMNVMRLPFLLERLFPDAVNFDQTEWGRFKQSINSMITAGSQVIIDPHNYYRFNNQIIGTSGSKLSVQGYAKLYAKIATEYKSNSKVIFALMNEPYGLSSTADLMSAWKVVIASIRATGAKNLILVSGNQWDSAPNWFGTFYNGPNSDNIKNLLKQLNDPNVYPEMHMYLDGDSSGSSPDCVSETIGVERLAPVTTWLKQNGFKGVLTEIGVGTSQTCLKALDNTLKHMQANCDGWAGFTYWAAGPWWGNYRYTIDPTSGDHPQTAIIKKYL